MNRQIVLTTLLVLSWGVADAAAPAEKGAYIGAGFGSTTLEDDGLFSGLTFDDSDSGFGIFGGYKFFKNLAVEARYTDFGTFTVEGLGTADLSIPGDSSSETVGSAGLGVRYSFGENVSVGLQTDAYAYEEADFGTTFDVGVTQTAITIQFSF